MKNLSHDDAVDIATIYAKGIVAGDFEVDGCELDETKDRPHWNVFISFCDVDEEWIGMPFAMLVEVDAVTGKASHYTF